MDGTFAMDHRYGLGQLYSMQRTFFWSKNSEILFSGWPGTSSGMYSLALIFVFILAVLVEWLSHCKLIKPESNQVVAGLFQTFLHAIRVGLTYLVILAIISFNGGIFLAAVAGHALGFLLFGSRSFKRSTPTPLPAKTVDV
ncbi:copper transporter 1-like [Pistacia vera]|uniref:copper transporter 1-like n=1 Tax=Pistacia vera TaxID=55513 RepID=UPI0012633A22|nr:copper transporter 1-like [Pistacia vera]